MSARLRRAQAITIIEQHEGPHDALAELAHALELPFGNASSVSLRFDRVLVRLELELVDEQVDAVLLSADFEVPSGTPNGPFLTLRKETARDRRDKDEGVVFEVQVDDGPFDASVFIDSNASDDEVQRVLARAGARAAIRTLLAAGARDLHLETRTVSCKLPRGRDLAAPWSADRLLPSLEAFVTLARGRGPRGESKSPNGEGMRALSAAAFALGSFCLAAVYTTWPTSLLFCATVFVLSGGATALAIRQGLSRMVAGDSSSGERMRFALAFFFLAGGGAGASLALAFNAAGLEGKPLVAHGRVLSVVERTRNSRQVGVHYRMDDGTTGWLQMTRLDEPREGQRLTVTWREGRLIAWDENVSVR